MTRQYVNDLSAAKNVNERAAAYAGEVIRLETVNAYLLAVLSRLVTFRDMPDSIEYESMADDALELGMTSREYEEMLYRDARESIRKAKGE